MGRYAGSGRTTVDGSCAIDVFYMRRHGLLTPGHSFTLSWSHNGKKVSSIGGYNVDGAVILKYRHRTFGGEWEDVEQLVPLEWTPCHFGGRRPGFHCNVYSGGVYCGRRVAKLYGNGKLYACRHCYDLRYASQREDWGNRALRKAQKLRERLGGDASLVSPLPDKPKGMHWRTYDGLVGKLKAAEGATNSYMLEWLSRLRG